MRVQHVRHVSLHPGNTHLFDKVSRVAKERSSRGTMGHVCLDSGAGFAVVDEVQHTAVSGNHS